MHQQIFIEEQGLESVIDRYSEMVYKLAFSYTRNKYDADDIFQEVFLRYLRKNPTFESAEHEKAWLIRVTINCCKKLHASAWRRRTVPFEGLEFETQEEIALYIDLQKLPIKYRVVIHLFYYEDMSISAISEALKMKESAVRTRLTRARQKLKEILREDYCV